MVTQAARPRLLNLAIVALLGLQAWLLVSAVVAAVQLPDRPALVLVANALTMVLLLSAMLVSQKHRRLTWALLALCVAGIVASAFVFSRMH